jgi:hypothetical protein
MRFKLLCPGFGARVGGLISWMIPALDDSYVWSYEKTHVES